jgi:2-polyprenyl-3-methyl-5-hydroxy-6-metoxy-1,4-benzoquinol methylase
VEIFPAPAKPMSYAFLRNRTMDRYQITIEGFDKLASAYQDKYMDEDLYDDTFDAFCQLVEKPGARIFEIGCGPGNITRYLLARRPDFAIEAIDFAPTMVELARANNPTARFKVMDCREMDQLRDQYDGIMCGFCMPYLSKEDWAKLIKDCFPLLNPGGVFYFSTIAGDYQKSGFESSSNGQAKAYVYYHQEAYLQGLLIENNFEPVDLIRKEFPKSDETFLSTLIFMARKK